MSNKTLITGILCFVCGILIGYATSYWTINKNKIKKRRQKRHSYYSDDNDDDDDDEYIKLQFKHQFEKEIDRLYNKLNNIEQQLKFNKNNDDDNSLSDELDYQTEQFYDTIEIIQDENNEQDDYDRIDELFENNYDVQYIYDYLKQKLSKNENNTEILWRLSKAAHFLSKTNENINNEELKKNLLYESHEMADKALKLNDHDANCHKWFAISIGCLKDYVSIKEKIQNGIKFKDHLDIALSLKNDDPTLYYLAGRFCLELLAISWAERKLAGMIVGSSLPAITNQDALQYFLKAYQIKPKWKENLFYIVQILIKLNEVEKANEYLQEALAIPLNENSGDDKTMHNKLIEIQKTKFS